MSSILSGQPYPVEKSENKKSTGYSVFTGSCVHKKTNLIHCSTSLLSL